MIPYPLPVLMALCLAMRAAVGPGATARQVIDPIHLRIDLGFVCVVMWAVEHPVLGRLKPDCNDRNLQLFDLSLALAPVAIS
jgi:hypothetical protein